jgi:hypothetical protein
MIFSRRLRKAKDMLEVDPSELDQKNKVLGSRRSEFSLPNKRSTRFEEGRHLM